MSKSTKIYKLVNFEHQEEVKVSIVVPVCNVQKYLCECLDSLVNQSLSNIEIICVDDGSSDNSSQILDEYAYKDKRVKVIHKENSGYGDSMNMGMAFAKGEYVGIIESDDFAELDMFERLYSVAKIHHADIVKSNFYLYWDNKGEKRNELFKIVDTDEDRQMIDPLNYKNGKMFKAKASIWSALYRKEFLSEKGIDFLTTPGASFQDTSFTFKVFASTERMVLVEDAYVHYRQDNEESSINNLDKKIPYVFKEYDEIFSFINIDDFYTYERKSEKRQRLGITIASFYDACLWMYEGLSICNRYNYLIEISEKFKILLDMLPVSEIAFGECYWKYRDIKRIAKTPFDYHIWREVERYKQNGNRIDLPQNYPQKKEENIDKIQEITFSIIIPVYNAQAYLTACLESIRNQAYKNYEVICINDGSTDDTEKILRYYNSFDNRFKIWNIENSGPSVARNLGMSKAIGKYILFIDSDDFYSENAIGCLAKRMQENEIDDNTNFVFSANVSPKELSNKWLEEHLQCKDSVFEDIKFKTFYECPFLGIYIWKWAFNRKFLLENKIFFDENLKWGEDALFLFSVLETSNKVISISNKIYNYRVTNEQSLMHRIEHTKEFAKMQLKILEQILQEIYNYGEMPSKEIFEFCADFIYGAINQNRDKGDVSDFVKLIKKYNLEEFANVASDNAKGFYEWCKEYTKFSIKRKGNISGIFKCNRIGNIIKCFIKKIVPVSRQAYYDYESKKMVLMEKQINEIDLLRHDLNSLK